jgi:hypothetical protein
MQHPKFKGKSQKKAGPPANLHGSPSQDCDKAQRVPQEPGWVHSIKSIRNSLVEDDQGNLRGLNLKLICPDYIESRRSPIVV